MIDNEGNLLDDATIFEDDWLPENWTWAITEAGETYYWDILTDQSNCSLHDIAVLEAKLEELLLCQCDD
eukprot:776313-Ditylum_brightwellii.AAC.1